MAFKIFPNLAISDFPISSDSPLGSGQPLLTDRPRISEQYSTAVIAPIIETLANEFEFGDRATPIAEQVNNKNKAVPVHGLASSLAAPPLQMVLKNSFMFPPPVIISMPQDPPDRYITGNIPSTFPSFGTGIHRAPLINCLIQNRNKLMGKKVR